MPFTAKPTVCRSQKPSQLCRRSNSAAPAKTEPGGQSMPSTGQSAHTPSGPESLIAGPPSWCEHCICSLGRALQCNDRLRYEHRLREFFRQNPMNAANVPENKCWFYDEKAEASRVRSESIYLVTAYIRAGAPTKCDAGSTLTALLLRHYIQRFHTFGASPKTLAMCS